MNRALKRRQLKLAKNASAKSGAVFDRHGQAMAEAARHYRSGQAGEAQAICLSILSSDGGHADANHLLGIIAMQQEDYPKAVDHLERAVTARPESSALRTHMGTALSFAGQLEAAAAAFNSALKLEPGNVDALNNLAALQMRRKDPLSAIRLYREALEQNGEVADIHANLANALLVTGEVDAAIVHYRRALEIRPGFAEADYGLGQALRDNGDMPEAIEHYERALARNPHHTNAMVSLAAIAENFDPGLQTRIRNARHFAPAGSERRMMLSFSLARIEEKNGNIEKAAELLREGNAAHRATLDFSLAKSTEQLHHIREIFTRDFMDAHKDHGISSAAPIFIVGMPRSGTTLVEQILASHPEVSGGGELSHLPVTVFAALQNLTPDGFPSAATSLDAADIGTIAHCYLEAVGTNVGPTRMFTDKLPGNFLMVGMIRLLFPNARIIHVTRDPRDTCLSMFKIFFPSGGHHFSYDIAELAEYYRSYHALMEHWKTLFGDAIIEANYETIVSDPENAIRALVEASGLEFDERCLNFHETRRVVRTASAAQVRKPIYTSSVGAWKKYEPYLPQLTQIGV